jgi:beta-glucosidase-like glycosyl hydrolase
MAHFLIRSCKHYFDYNLEDWGGVDRHHFDAITTKQDLADTYLPAFESCVVNGKASSLMWYGLLYNLSQRSSYNSVNGVPSCANKAYMDDLARDVWGFEG